MGSFLFQEICFFGPSLVVLCGILRLVFSLCLEEFELPGGVVFVFTTEREIKKIYIFMIFLTMFFLLFELGALFLSLGIAALV